MFAAVLPYAGDERLTVSLLALAGAVAAVAACRVLWRAYGSSAGKADVSTTDESPTTTGTQSSLSPDNAKITGARKAQPVTPSRGRSPAPGHHRHAESEPLLQPGTAATRHQHNYSGHSQQQARGHSRSPSGADVRSSSRVGLAQKSEAQRDEPSHQGPVTSQSLEHVEDDKDLEDLSRLLEENVRGILDEERRREEDADTHSLDTSARLRVGPPAPLPEGPGKYYREMARQEAVKKRNAYEASKRAYKMGHGADAKRLSEEGRICEERLRQYNAMAAQEIFQHWNPRYNGPSSSGRPFSRCDLHGLHIEEAIEYARTHVINCRRAGVDKTMIIVGKGSHSQQGVSRIGPAILQMLSQTNGVVAGAHEKNDGCIVIEFTAHQVHHQPVYHMTRSSGLQGRRPVTVM